MEIPQKPPRWRRWMQFRLRTFLVLSVVLALVIWWLVPEQEDKSKKRLPGGVTILDRSWGEVAPASAGLDATSARTERTVRGPRGYYLARGELKENIADGEWSYYDDRGRLVSKGTHNLGAMWGTWRWWYANGQIEREQEFGYPNGDVDGLKWISVYNVRHGLQTQWWDNGVMRSRGRFEHDRQVGKWEYWDQQSRLTAVGEFRDGMKHGVWRELHEDSGSHVEHYYLLGRVIEDPAALLDKAKRDLDLYYRQDRLEAIDLLAFIGPDGAPAILEALDDLVDGEDDSLCRFALVRLRDATAGGSLPKFDWKPVECAAEQGDSLTRLEALFTWIHLEPSRESEMFGRMLRLCHNEPESSRERLVERVVGYSGDWAPLIRTAFDSANRESLPVALKLVEGRVAKLMTEPPPNPANRLRIQRIAEALAACRDDVPEEWKSRVEELRADLRKWVEPVK